MTRSALTLVALVALVPVGRAAQPDPAALATKIDARVARTLSAHKIEPVGSASDSEFLRRATLDITGQVPTVAEARAFLNDPAADKRGKLVDALLARPAAVNHAAAVWRQALIPQAALNPRLQYLNVSFEVWLRDRLRAGRRADELVRELLTAPLDYLDRDAKGTARPVPGPSALAFYQANDLKPDTVAAGASRALLGIKIECAQCHDHPFDKWTQPQFWQTAAFFAPVQPPGPSDPRKPAAELLLRKTVSVNDTKVTATPKFLDGTEPDWAGATDTRQRFAEWATAKANPYFAKATANRVWAQFFGVGLVDPTDDFNPENGASHPELLDDLARALVEADFDTNHLARAIGRTATYGRSSRGTAANQTDPRKFARMNVKGLSPEQLFDALARATGFREEVPGAARPAFGVPDDSPRGAFLAKFAGGTRRTDAQASILQALALMNGEWVAEQTDPVKGRTLVAVLGAPFLTDAERVEVLFLTAYARKPTAAESEKYASYLARDGADGRGARLADVFWALLNSQEFLLNH